MSYFKNTPVNIIGNSKLRSPQIEAYIKIQDYFRTNPHGEALVVLPTGTGKSGLISIAPFDVSNGRVLIITPGLVTKESISKTQEALKDNFWVNYDVIFNHSHVPNINEYDSSLLEEYLYSSHIVYSNIHKIVGNNTYSLIQRVPPDFFDMIIIDESHHSPANSWTTVLNYFSKAKKLHVTGTPYRGDGQILPGEKIHETSLSEVMRDRYVKFLRKETVNAHELFFTLPDKPGIKFSKEDVLEFKDNEWLEKSVALSKECSLDVINHSVLKLKELKGISPKVNHKILAVGCSISHAEDLVKWYQEKGLKTVIIHSAMEKHAQLTAFRAIENHDCQVVVSVNMLMEGYDHKHLTILSIFRPYKSLNAFAQVIGRVLRTIPENEITAFEIDNNALIIYHEETGLNSMWEDFQKEINRAKYERIKDYTPSDLEREYSARDNSLAAVSSDAVFISDQDSFLEDLDFNALFEKKRQEINSNINNRLDKLTDQFNSNELESIKALLLNDATLKAAEDIDPELLEKRPAQAAKKLKDLITKKTNDEATNLLIDLGIDPKATNLAQEFSRYIRNLPPNTANDGTIVRYIYYKLFMKYGAVNTRDNPTLISSL